MLGDQPIVSESQLAALEFATGGGRSPSSDVTAQKKQWTQLVKHGETLMVGAINELSMRGRVSILLGEFPPLTPYLFVSLSFT